jgi:cytoskeletal protein CcmA (bactofilin family)
MKKLLLKSTAFILCSISLSSQAQEWKKNSAHTALYAQDQFGGTNITGIGIGIVNPTARLEVFGRIKFHSTLMLDSTLNIGSNYSINGLNGSFKNASWASASNRFMQVDANGSLIPFPVGSPSQVLYGNGTWGTLPVVPVIWQQAGSAAYYNNGSVGIGTNAPQAALDVVGDVKVSNNLYVGGGILISQKVEASSSMKTDTIHSTSGETKFTGKLMLLDKIQVEGATLLKSQFQVNGTSLFNGTVQANNLNVSGVINFGNGANVNGILNTSNLNVTNNTTFAGGVTSPTGFKFDNAHGITYTPASGSSPSRYNFNGGNLPTAVYCAASPNPGAINYFGNSIQLFDQTNLAGTGLLNLQNWTGGSSIDASTGSTSTGALLLNYFCHSPTSINTGWDIPNGVDGGTVYMGAKVDLQSSLKIGYSGIPSVVDLNTSIEVHQNTQNASGVKVKTYNNSIKAFSIEAYTGGTNNFVVYGDGRTVIGDSYAPAGYQLAVKGKVIAEEVVVQLRATWPDYVFAKNYNLKPLSEIEAYIKEHKHLQNIPSAKEIEKEGVTLGTIVTKQMEKIEELTLYLIEQQKQIEELKKLVDSIKK